ncbi:MAG TPA: hypothetical protein VIJ51_12415 [Solirubrobacteraceae bacterium]
MYTKLSQRPSTTRRNSGSSGLSWRWGAALGACAVFAMLLVAGPVIADISPAGCTNNASSLSLNKDQTVVRNGDTIHYSADFENDTAGGCDVTNATTTLTVPAANGTASGPTTTLATAQNYPNPTARQQVGGTVSYVVAVNAGVSQIFASDQLTGILHDYPAGGTPDSTQKANTVSVAVTQPHTTLVKTASPSSGPVPLPVTYSYTETNDGTNAPISGVALTDSNCSPVTFVSGDANSDGVLNVGETWHYTCSKTLTTAGTISNTATATGTDVEDGKPAPAETATASVVVAPATPTLSTAATTAAAVPPATSPTISDTATISGGLAPTGTVTFQVFGPNDATCSGSAIFTSTATVNGNGTYSSGPFTPTAAGTYRFEAGYNGDAANAGISPVCNSPGESVTITPPGTTPPPVTPPPAAPQIGVTKVASPLTLVTPGGTFKFTVTVSNPSTTVPVVISTLNDSVYGNLATRPGSTCGALIGVVLAPGATTGPCTFTGIFKGAAGAKETDVVTVTGTSNGTTVTATAQATVSLTPKVTPAALVSAATLTRPAGCVKGTTAKIYVKGSNIKSVSFSLDSKHLGTVTKQDSSGRYLITVKTSGLSARIHHLVAVVTDKNGKKRTLSASIQRCQPPRVPLFTG